MRSQRNFEIAVLRAEVKIDIGKQNNLTDRGNHWLLGFWSSHEFDSVIL